MDFFSHFRCNPRPSLLSVQLKLKLHMRAIIIQLIRRTQIGRMEYFMHIYMITTQRDLLF
jgi:hypothetical protein